MSEYLAYSTFYSISLPSDRLLDNAYPYNWSFKVIRCCKHISYCHVF